VGVERISKTREGLIAYRLRCRITCLTARAQANVLVPDRLVLCVFHILHTGLCRRGAQGNRQGPFFRLVIG